MTLLLRQIKRYLPFVVIVCAIVVAGLMVGFRAEPRRQVQSESVPSVRVHTVQTQTLAPVIEGFGEVTPRREAVIRSQVAGKIQFTSEALTPGGYFKQGAQLLQIDERDYAALVDQREAELAEASLAFEQEFAQQEIARQEWERAQRSHANPAEGERLALRVPQRQLAQRRLSAARSRLEQAQRDRQKTTIHTPFNGFVMSEEVEVGQVIQTNAALCRFVGSDHFYVVASLHQSVISRVSVAQGPASGASVRIVLSQGQTRSGHVVRVLPQLDAKSRMAKVVIEVADPLALLPENAQLAPLFIGDFVRLEIDSAPFERGVRISRALLRDDDTVWVVQNEQLRIRPVDVLFGEKDAVIIDGVRAGEQLIASALTIATEGMRVRKVVEHE